MRLKCSFTLWILMQWFCMMISSVVVSVMVCWCLKNLELMRFTLCILTEKCIVSVEKNKLFQIVQTSYHHPLLPSQGRLDSVAQNLLCLIFFTVHMIILNLVLFLKFSTHLYHCGPLFLFFFCLQLFPRIWFSWLYYASWYGRNVLTVVTNNSNWVRSEPG